MKKYRRHIEGRIPALVAIRLAYIAIGIAILSLLAMLIFMFVQVIVANQPHYYSPDIATQMPQDDGDYAMSAPGHHKRRRK